MNIDNLTIKEAREIATLLTNTNAKTVPVEIGKAYLFRTVTHIEVGRVKSVDGAFITLEQASWIADTGRYHDCFRDGTFNEVEPYPDLSILNSESLINFAPWDHDLPTKQK